VKPCELPEPWGLMACDGGELRIVKKAPLLVPKPLSPAFIAALVRRFSYEEQRQEQRRAAAAEALRRALHE
jgi:hypothetical protein